MAMSQIIRDTNKNEEQKPSKSQNPKNTLFRFVTMRAPELVEDAHVKSKFVTLGDDEFKKSHFMSVLMKDSSENKTDVRNNLAFSFKDKAFKLEKIWQTMNFTRLQLG